MSEMVERVARELFSQGVMAKFPSIQGDWTRLQLPARATYLKQARLAIAAMRKPTLAMAKAGDAEEDRLGKACLSENYWQAMIDAALE